MIKIILNTVTVLALLSTYASAADNHCTNLAQDACTSEVACKWKVAENWTRAEDGKTRSIKAKCLFDAKSAKAQIEAKYAPAN